MTAELHIDAIIVGERIRSDMGDIDELAQSISEVGLLHPVVVTEDDHLIAGGRRLQAVKMLGWPRIPVTVVSLFSWDDLEAALQAEADENTCRKSLTPTEAARMREARVKALRKAQVIRPKGRPVKDEPDNSSNLDELPRSSDRAARKRGAKSTGYSGSTLDKVDKVTALAESDDTPEPVRETAREALAEMDRTNTVDAPYKKATEAQQLHTAVTDFPDLTFYAEAGRPADAIRLAGALRGYDEPELSVRLDALRRTIDAERNGRLTTPKPDGPDYTSLANDMFLAANNAAQVIEKAGGADTLDIAAQSADQATITFWREQFESLAETCTALAYSSTHKMKVVR